jgi:hypothetical protein
MIMVGDGRGRAVRGIVVEVRPSSVVVEVAYYIATPAEPLRFVAAQAQPVAISDGVLRTSTAGVVALAGLKLRRERAGAPRFSYVP